MGLSNAQYDSIMRVYTERRLAEERELAERKKEVFVKIPEIPALIRKTAGAASETARKVADGDARAADAFRQKIAAIAERRKTLLRANGYPEDYLEMHYVCSDCRDTGYISGKKCHCFREMEIRLLYNQSNLRERLKEENFGHFRLDLFDDTARDPLTGKTARENMRDAARICRNYVEEFPEKYGSILFTGKTGLGKTYLSCCIAKELIDRCMSVVYLPASEMFDIFEKERFSGDVTEEDRSRSRFLMDCDLLIIDDLGTELVNTFTVSRLFSVINGRLIGKKGTIISTNLAVNDMRDEFTDRIMSRIVSSYTVIRLFGDDVRIRKRAASL